MSSTADKAAKSGMVPPPHTSETSTWDVLGPLAVLGVAGAFSAWFVASDFARNNFRLDNDGSREVVALGVAMMAMLVIAWGIRLGDEGRPNAFQRLRDRTMVTLGLLGVFGYFNFGHLHFGGFVHVWDTYHYYIGAKYFAELGYERMYDCAAVVDAESGRLAEVQRRNHTDLRTNLITPTRDVVENADQVCKQYFTPERWEQYKADINSIRSMVNEGRWKEIHLDHGYNATPVWTLAGQFFANLRPATTDGLIHVNLLDPIYVFLTMLMVWWAFGARGFALAGIVLGCNFPNRYYWTGGAFLRHDWLFYLVASVCLLRKNMPVLGGLSFSYTVLLRLFPGLAVLGPAIGVVEYLRQNKKLDPAFLKYVAGGVAGTVVLVGGSFALLPKPPPNRLVVDVTMPDPQTAQLSVKRLDAKTEQPSTWLKGPQLIATSSLPGLTVALLEQGSGFTIRGTAAANESPLTEEPVFAVKIGGDETLRVPLAPNDTAATIAGRVKEAFQDKATRDADGSGVAMWKRFAANTIKHASTPLTNHMGLRTILTYRPSTVGSQMSNRLLIDSWKPWKEMKIELWNQMKPVFLLLMAVAVALVYFALRNTGPSLYLAACLGVGFIVFGAELTNYYYCFLLCMAALYEEKREVGLLLAGLSAMTLIINFGWLTFQSHELDQQYTSMSYASVLTMLLVWYSFSRWGTRGAAPSEVSAGPWHDRWVLVGLGAMSLFILNAAVNKAWGAPVGDSGFGIKVWLVLAGALFGLFKLAAKRDIDSGEAAALLPKADKRKGKTKTSPG
jgi:hypothetical protein